MAHWAPVIYQDTDSSSPVADYLTRFDYDGNWRADDNWDNLQNANSFLGASVYYWVVETDSHWFVEYALFHYGFF